MRLSKDKVRSCEGTEIRAMIYLLDVYMRNGYSVVA